MNFLFIEVIYLRTASWIIGQTKYNLAIFYLLSALLKGHFLIRED